MLRRRGKDREQTKTYNQNHEKIRNLLLNAIDGIGVREFKREIPLSERIVYKHLKDFGDHVKRRKGRYYWEPTYQKYLQFLKRFEWLSLRFKRPDVMEALLKNYAILIIPTGGPNPDILWCHPENIEKEVKVLLEERKKMHALEKKYARAQKKG